MLAKQKNNLLFFQFNSLAAFPRIRHGIFARINGFSTGVYAGLNMSLSVGDDAHAVKQNRAAASRCMGGGTLIFLHQAHQTDVMIIKDGPSDNRKDDQPLTGDALVTDRHGVALAIKLADCQSIMMYDYKKKVIANVHSGWRGSIQNIIGRTIAFMEGEFGCNPENIIAGIGPSLGPCCAEFINYQTEIPKRFHKYKDGSNYFDFWQISRDQLVDAGVQCRHIELAGMCTKCNPHLFFSYREANRTGRFAAIIGLS